MLSALDLIIVRIFKTRETAWKLLNNFGCKTTAKERN